MMFRRLVWRFLWGSPGRLVVALVALTSGAAVISGLLNLELDMDHKLNQEFRSLGANVILAPKADSEAGDAQAGTPPLVDEAPIESGLAAMNSPDLLASAPYLYLHARVGNSSVIVAGTWLDQVRALDPTGKLEGRWPAARSDLVDCLVGRNVARSLQLRPASEVDLSYLTENVRLTVAGIVDSGESEDSQILIPLSVAQKLAGTKSGVELWQLSVTGTAPSVAKFIPRLASRFPDLDVRPIRQVTQAEGDLLNRIRLLIVGLVLLILVLTGLCVLATMAALAMERREDVGLMKALGGSISRVVGIFLAEVGVLGAAGGLLGSIAGIGLSAWMGWRVFGTAISPRWEVFPLTISLMIAVALAGALPLRLLGKVKPAVILRGD
jgi:putative ABC transport system permease protein